jgi:hypothetical protein
VTQINSIPASEYQNNPKVGRAEPSGALNKRIRNVVTNRHPGGTFPAGATPRYGRRFDAKPHLQTVLERVNNRETRG